MDAALPVVLGNLIDEDTYHQVRDAYLRAAHAVDPHDDRSLWLRWLVIKDTNRGCLRGVPAVIAEACRVIVLDDIVNGTQGPLLPRSQTD